MTRELRWLPTYDTQQHRTMEFDDDGAAAVLHVHASHPDEALTVRLTRHTVTKRFLMVWVKLDGSSQGCDMQTDDLDTAKGMVEAMVQMGSIPA